MTKLTRALALMVALATLSAGAVAVSSAQDKTKPAAKDDKKKDGKKEKEKVGTIEVYKGKNGFRYRVKGADGKTVAMPLPQMAWETKEACLKAVEDLKETLDKGKVVDAKE